jgi:hypothetical protein
VRVKSTVDLDRLSERGVEEQAGGGRSRTTIVLRTSKETTRLPIAGIGRRRGSKARLDLRGDVAQSMIESGEILASKFFERFADRWVVEVS